jgi:hypothetical protein
MSIRGWGAVAKTGAAKTKREGTRMFKHYLTYGFVVRFNRSCQALEIPVPLQSRLMKSADQLLQYFTRSIHAKNPKDELKWLCVAVWSLRDCREILHAAGVRSPDLMAEYDVVHHRLEQICAKASEHEEKQLRMLG